MTIAIGRNLTNDPTSKATYRPEVDGLRALAVIVVIINHIDRGAMPSGYLGVDMFFVISGYVITSSLTGRGQESLWEFLVGFYSRRVKRLVPPLILCVTVGSVLTCLCNPFPVVSLKTGIAALFGASNLYQWRNSADYFGISAELNTFTHTWSLGVEEQFYLIYPFLVWASGYSKKTERGTRYLIAIVGVMSLASVAAAMYLNVIRQQLAYFFMPTRLWELGIGCIAFVGQRRLRLLANGVRPEVVLAVMFASLFLAPRYAFLATVAVVLLSATLILSMRPGSLAYRFFSYSPVVRLGMLSYSLYLWHWVTLVTLRWASETHWWSIPVQLTIMFALAEISYRNIETRLRIARWSSANWRTIAYGLAASLSCATFVILVIIPLRYILYLRPNPWKNATSVANSLPCHRPEAAEAISSCLQRKGNGIHVFVLGDSHAANVYPSILKAVEHTDITVRYLTDAVMVENMFECGSSLVSECGSNQFAQTLEYMRAVMKPGDWIVFSAARDRIYENKRFYGVSRRGSEDKRRATQFKAALLRLNSVTLSVHSRLVLVDDIPKLCDSESYPLKVAQNAEAPCSIPSSISIDDREPLTKTFQAMLSLGALYLDPHPYLCGAQCTSLLNGTLLYSDGSPHFSNYSPTPLVGMFKDSFRSSSM